MCLYYFSVQSCVRDFNLKPTLYITATNASNAPLLLHFREVGLFAVLQGVSWEGC